MLSFTKVKNALRETLDIVAPETEHRYRPKVHYPMAVFRHTLREIVNTYPQITAVSFEFPEEAIKNELTTCIFRTEKRRIKLVSNHKTNTVDYLVMGSDLDPIKGSVNVSELLTQFKEFVPPIPKRVIKVVRKVKAGQ